MGGGLNASTSASLMPAVFMNTSPTSCGVVTLRSSQCFWVTKIEAALLRNPPPRKSNPVNAITYSLAGLEWIAFSTSATTSSVRCSVAPSGRITVVKNQPWSSSGTRLPGVKRHSPIVSTTMPANSATPITPRRSIHTTPSL